MRFAAWVIRAAAAGDRRDWKLETGNWTLETGHWKLDTGHGTLLACGIISCALES